VQVSGKLPPEVEFSVSTHAGNDRIVQSSDIHGSSDFTFYGGFGEDFIEMNGEVLDGRGSVRLFGEPGDDFIQFGEGDVEVDGGKGDDVIVSTATRLAGSTVRGNDGNDRISGLIRTIRGEDGRDTFVDVDPDHVRDLEAGEEVNGVIDSPEDDAPSADEPEPAPAPAPAQEDPAPGPELAPTPDPIPTPGAAAPAVLGAVSDLRRVWYVGRIDLLGALGPTGTLLTVLEFNDGTVTTDVDTVVADGRAVSRRANPGEWGTSRVSNGTLSYRFDGTSSDVQTLFTASARSARSNERLDDCFGSTRGFGSGGVVSISVNTLGLDRSGRFSNDRTVATSNPTGSGSSNSQLTGTYRVDGHAIRLDYDDGKLLQTTFGIYEEDRRIETLLVGERALNR